MFSLSDSNIEFSILINGSNPIQIYRDPITNSANFVEGRKGSEFQIQVKNNNYYRVCVIPSVDGLSTIDGKTATKDSPSFIIEPRSTIKIPGWTIDHNTISAFKFTDMSKSYSKEVTGTDQKVGVVGIMVFNEKPQLIGIKYTVIVRIIRGSILLPNILFHSQLGLDPPMV